MQRATEWGRVRRFRWPLRLHLAKNFVVRWFSRFSLLRQRQFFIAFVIVIVIVAVVTVVGVVVVVVIFVVVSCCCCLLQLVSKRRANNGRRHCRMAMLLATRERGSARGAWDTGRRRRRRST